MRCTFVLCGEIKARERKSEGFDLLGVGWDTLRIPRGQIPGTLVVSVFAALDMESDVPASVFVTAWHRERLAGEWQVRIQKANRLPVIVLRDIQVTFLGIGVYTFNLKVNGVILGTQDLNVVL